MWTNASPGVEVRSPDYRSTTIKLVYLLLVAAAGIAIRLKHGKCLAWSRSFCECNLTERFVANNKLHVAMVGIYPAVLF
jgi:hypothetical protein